MSNPENGNPPELEPRVEQEIIDTVLPRALSLALDRLDMVEDFERKSPETTVSLSSEICRGSMVYTHQFAAAHNIEQQTVDYQVIYGETENQYLDELNEKERRNIASLLMNIDVEQANVDIEYYIEVLQGSREAEDSHVLTWHFSSEYMYDPTRQAMTLKTGQSVLIDGMLINESTIGKNYCDTKKDVNDEFAAIVGEPTSASDSTVDLAGVAQIQTSLSRLGLA